MADFYGGNALVYDIQSGSIMAGGYKIESTSMMHNFEGGGKNGKNDNDNENNDNYIISCSKFGLNICLSCGKK